MNEDVPCEDGGKNAPVRVKKEKKEKIFFGNAHYKFLAHDLHGALLQGSVCLCSWFTSATFFIATSCHLEVLSVVYPLLVVCCLA